MALNRNVVSTKTTKIVDNSNRGTIWNANQAEDIDVSSVDYSDALGFGVFVGVQGNLEVTMIDGGKVVWPDQVGWIPIVASIIHSENTTATGIKVYI